MPGIRGDNAAGPLLAVERDRVSRQIIAPESVVELAPQCLGGFCESRRYRVVAERARQLCRVPLSGIDIALHLAERDRTIGEFAICMKDRVPGILPTLISEAGGALAVIFDKAVMIRIAIGVDPLQRRLDIRPDTADRVEIAGARVIGAGEHDEER